MTAARSILVAALLLLCTPPCDSAIQYADFRMNFTTCDGLEMLLEFSEGACETIEGGKGFFKDFEGMSLGTKSSVAASTLSMEFFYDFLAPGTCTTSIGKGSVADGQCSNVTLFGATSLMLSNVRTMSEAPAPSPVPEVSALGAALTDENIAYDMTLDIGFGTSCSTNALHIPKLAQGACTNMTELMALGGGAKPLAIYTFDLFVGLVCHEKGMLFTLSTSSDCSQSTELVGVPATLPFQYPVTQTGCQNTWLDAKTAVAGTQKAHLPLYVGAGACVGVREGESPMPGEGGLPPTPPVPSSQSPAGETPGEANTTSPATSVAPSHGSDGGEGEGEGGLGESTASPEGAASGPTKVPETMAPEGSDGLPVWAIVLIVIGGLLLLGGAAAVALGSSGQGKQAALPADAFLELESPDEIVEEYHTIGREGDI
eukprot:TRINITY_DN4325_c1_g1_i1.p1 TRINITY_DN4325_c1_g1~~TRINITY_DN4325_c1_g1_i1.p1  ORF type:complete len:429 (+),score=111.21 TRINITY_DN4325_c1_g1_i1:336-1622(+)